MTKQSHYNVGIYVRLSQEDEHAGESISIENQKKMLMEYVSKQAGWNLVEIYEDDGYSGTDFDEHSNGNKDSSRAYSIEAKILILLSKPFKNSLYYVGYTKTS